MLWASRIRGAAEATGALARRARFRVPDIRATLTRVVSPPRSCFAFGLIPSLLAQGVVARHAGSAAFTTRAGHHAQKDECGERHESTFHWTLQRLRTIVRISGSLKCALAVRLGIIGHFAAAHGGWRSAPRVSGEATDRGLASRIAASASRTIPNRLRRAASRSPKKEAGGLPTHVRKSCVRWAWS